MRFIFLFWLKLHKSFIKRLYSPPYAIWQELRLDSNFGCYNQKGEEENWDKYIGDLFIWPDRLRWYFFSFGIVVFFPWLFTEKCFVGIIGIFINSILYPYITFVTLRKNILRGFTGKCGTANYNLFRRVPMFRTFKERRPIIEENSLKMLWFKTKRYGRRVEMFIRVLIHLTPLWSNTNDAVYWRMQGSFQQACIKMAIAGLFIQADNIEIDNVNELEIEYMEIQPEPDSGARFVLKENVYAIQKDQNIIPDYYKDLLSPNVNLIFKKPSPTFSKEVIKQLIIYWCAPVIISYAILTMICIVLAIIQDKTLKNTISLSILLWLICAVIFFFRETKTVAIWMKHTREDANYVYPYFLRYLNFNPKAAELLEAPKILPIIAACDTLGAGLLLLFIQTILS